MPRALRLKLDPIPGAKPDDGGLIEGLRLSLSDLGKGASKAKLEGAPAKITFRLAVRDKVREGADPTREDLGALTGRIELRGAALSPVFVISDEKALSSAFEDLELTPAPAPGVAPGSPAAARRPKPRTIRLQFQDFSFEGSEVLTDSRLLVPSRLLAGAHFMELEGLLEVAGSTEAEFATNDVLDGRITLDSPPPIPTFDVLLLDDRSEPLAGVALRFEANGESAVVTTDATGFARKLADQSGQGSVFIDDLSALRARLQPEWDKADRGQGVEEPIIDDETTVFALRGEESPEALLDTETPRVIRVYPYVFLARLKGMFFDLNKSFLLPSALPGLKQARSIYDDNNPGKLLIVGHTDTSGQAANNDTLSLERARSVAAYLADDDATWEKQFDASRPEGRRWGKPEDELMIKAVTSFDTSRQGGETPIAFFHRTRGLPAGASLTKDERRQLIVEYMAQDGANVKEQGLDIEVITHGAGENFPVDATGEELDGAPADGKQEQLDRRVELFFFDKELGIQPKVADGSNSKPKSLEYPEWRRRATELREIGPEGGLGDRLISVILLSNSGNQPLANRTVTLRIEGEAPFTGATDANGVFEKTGLPPGDHQITVDGITSFVAATPTDVLQRPHVVVGHKLLG